MWVRPSNYKAIGKCLAAARLRAGLTQQQPSHKLRKPQSFVSSYERRQRRIDVAELMIIANAIGTDARKLFSEIYASKHADR